MWGSEAVPCDLIKKTSCWSPKCHRSGVHPLMSWCYSGRKTVDYRNIKLRVIMFTSLVWFSVSICLLIQKMNLIPFTESKPVLVKKHLSVKQMIQHTFCLFVFLSYQIWKKFSAKLVEPKHWRHWPLAEQQRFLLNWDELSTWVNPLRHTQPYVQTHGTLCRFPENWREEQILLWGLWSKKLNMLQTKCSHKPDRWQIHEKKLILIGTFQIMWQQKSFLAVSNLKCFKNERK